MWEYMRITRCCIEPEEMLEQLNQWGKQDWEVIQYEEKNTAIGHKKKDTHYFVLLKRKIQPEKKVL